MYKKLFKDLCKFLESADISNLASIHQNRFFKTHTFYFQIS